MNISRGQHYVWGYYLKAWALDRRIWCHRNGRIFNPNVDGIGKQRNFYKVRRMSLDDIVWLRKFCDQQIPEVRTYAHTIVNGFNELFEIGQRLKSAGAEPDEVDRRIDQLSIDLEEKHVQGAVEQAGKPYLDALRAGNTEFYKHPSERLIFLQFLCTQYVRTKRMHDGAMSGPTNMTFRSPENVWSPLCHIIAAALSAGLVRGDYVLYILRNRTGLNLLTADQPVVNLHAADIDANGLVNHFELYYPVSPKVAALVSLTPPDDTHMTTGDIARYNAHMIAQSHEMVFASSRNEVEALPARTNGSSTAASTSTGA